MLTTNALSPQARGRLNQCLHGQEWVDLAGDIAQAVGCMDPVGILAALYGLTRAQHTALVSIHDRYNGLYDPAGFAPTFDLPPGYVAGWVTREDGTHAIYVGVSPGGEISS